MSVCPSETHHLPPQPMSLRFIDNLFEAGVQAWLKLVCSSSDRAATSTASIRVVRIMSNTHLDALNQTSRHQNELAFFPRLFGRERQKVALQ